MDPKREGVHENSRELASVHSDGGQKQHPEVLTQINQVAHGIDGDIPDTVKDIKNEIFEEEYTEPKWWQEASQSEKGAKVEQIKKKKKKKKQKKFPRVVVSNCLVQTKYCEQCEMTFEGVCPVHGPEGLDVSSGSFEGLNSRRHVMDSKLLQMEDVSLSPCQLHGEDIKHSENGIYPYSQCCLGSSPGEIWHSDINSTCHVTHCDSAVSSVLNRSSKSTNKTLRKTITKEEDMYFITTVRAKDGSSELRPNDGQESVNVIECHMTDIDTSENDDNDISQIENDVNASRSDFTDPSLQGDGLHVSLNGYFETSQTENGSRFQNKQPCLHHKSAPNMMNASFSQKFNNDQSDINSRKLPYTCDLCCLSFPKGEELLKHKTTHTDERPYRCETCGIVFIKSSSLKNHRRVHSGQKSYHCDVCNAGFTESRYLRKHKKIHNGENPYKCGACEVDFTQATALKKHKVLHIGAKPFECDICNVKFTAIRYLKKHKRIHTGEKPYRCDVCGVGFTESWYLKTHKRIHTGEKPYKCDICGVGFTQSITLKKHRITHTGEKPYKCDVCGVAFTQSGHLKRHNRIHTGERPYKCDVCGVGFTDKSGVQKHKRIHTGEKPYRCDICGVGFKESGDLKRHRRIHTGERPCACDVCGLGFTDRSGLQRHKRIHTGEKLYKCDICGIDFTRSVTLRKHRKTHTGLIGL